MKTFAHIKENDLIWFICRDSKNKDSFQILIFAFDSVSDMYLQCKGGFVFTFSYANTFKPIVVYGGEYGQIFLGAVSASPIFIIRHLSKRYKIKVDNISNIIQCNSLHDKVSLHVPSHLISDFLKLRTYDDLINFNIKKHIQSIKYE